MKERLTIAVCTAAAAALILDSQCAAESAASALELCLRTLIPGLFPLFVISGMLVPYLGRTASPSLARLLRMPAGSEGIFLLGLLGGFPVGAACICQAVQGGSLGKRDAERMIGFCSGCGPAFLFGVLPAFIGGSGAVAVFLIQLETALLIAAFRRDIPADGSCGPVRPVGLPEAVQKGCGSMTSVCAWVVLAGVLTGFLRKWLFPLLPQALGVLLTGLLELTGGCFALDALPSAGMRFLLAAVFVCFGGVSVLLQIRALAADAGLSMGCCIRQKTVQAFLAAAIALLHLRFGWAALIPGALLPFGKIAVEISGPMVYNVREKGGI